MAEAKPEQYVSEIASGTWRIDLGFKGVPEVIAAYLLAGDDSLALIETGPTTTLPALRQGIATAGFSSADLTDVLVTHIHLDHSGGAGVLLREAPRARIWVHPIGAPHLVNPAKLLASAGRIYGDRMEELWGEVA
ncbi:MAG: MBL fold metallo-hydrolase, partial [Thermomicrobiales bacterium]